MNKSAKSKASALFLILGIGLIVFSLGKSTGLFAVTTVGNTQIIESYKTCSEVLASRTGGVGEGQCFVFENGNFKELRYVSEVYEEQIECTYGNYISVCKRDYATGKSYKPFCHLETTSDPVSTLTCNTARVDDKDVRVCSNSADCSGGVCEGGLCRSDFTGTCTPGMRRCFQLGNYQECQSNSRWGSVLNCGTGQDCYQPDGQCKSQVCTPGETKCISSLQFYCKDKYTWENQGKILGKCGYNGEDSCPVLTQKCPDGSCKYFCSESNWKDIFSGNNNIFLIIGIILVILALII